MRLFRKGCSDASSKSQFFRDLFMCRSTSAVLLAIVVMLSLVQSTWADDLTFDCDGLAPSLGKDSEVPYPLIIKLIKDDATHKISVNIPSDRVTGVALQVKEGGKVKGEWKNGPGIKLLTCTGMNDTLTAVGDGVSKIDFTWAGTLNNSYVLAYTIVASELYWKGTKTESTEPASGTPSAPSKLDGEGESGSPEGTAKSPSNLESTAGSAEPATVQNLSHVVLMTSLALSALRLLV